MTEDNMKKVAEAHIYAQAFPHDWATIRGNVEALTAIRDAITAAIESGEAVATVYASDGEGYDVVCQRVGDGELTNPPPYTDDICASMRAEAFGAPSEGE